MRIPTLAWSACFFAAASNVATAQHDREDARSAAPLITLRSTDESMDSTLIENTALTRSDLRNISQMLEGRATIVPLRTVAKIAGPGEQPLIVSVTGTTPEFADSTHLRMRRGRFLTSHDLANRNNVAVLDPVTAKLLFPDDNPVGRSFRIEQQALVVVGVCDASPALPTVGPVDRSVLIPITTMRSRFGDVEVTRQTGTFLVRRYELSEIRIALNDAMHLASVVEAVKKLLDDAHQPGDYSLEVTP